MTYYKIVVKKWFQKTYGNTYHSVELIKVSGTGKNYKQETVGYQPFNYGYGDHYLNTAASMFNLIKKEAYTEADLRNDLRNNPENYIIQVTNVNRKKDL